VLPISLRDANAFVLAHHRHSGQVRGCKFCVAVVDDLDAVHGVAIVGRPVARRLDDGKTAEVTRLCTDGIANGCSFLYSRCARIAKLMGYQKIITYTLATENGASLSFRLAMCAGTARRRELECAGAPQSRQPQHRPQTALLQRIEVTRVLYLILLCFGTLFGLGAFFLLAGLLRLPTSASTKAVLTVTSRGKSQKGSINAVLFDMAARLSPLVHLDGYKRKKLEAQLKSAEIKMSPETYIAAAWVKAGLIALLIIPALLIFPILAPVIVFLAVAVYFKEQKRADEIVQQRREEIEAELPRFVNTIEQELRASRDVLNILKSYQRNAGHAMKRELEITIADMASGNEENALTRMESRIGSTMLSDVVRGLISVKRGDNGIMYFQMLSMTFKQLELQKLKLEAMKQPGKMRKYSFMLLGCFLLMYLGVLGYVVLEAFGELF
jgi:Flp pilus assembly protein TadB